MATRERVRFEKFDLGAFDNTGDPRFSIVLNNDTVWTPEWENLVLSLKYAIRTEAKNEAGDPQSNLVGTILTILNNNGYKVIQSPSEKTKKSGFLYECEITVKISDSIESTDVVYLQASDHFDAVQKATRQVQDELVNRLRNSPLSENLMEVVSSRSRLYERRGDWKEHWIDHTEAGF